MRTEFNVTTGKTTEHKDVPEGAEFEIVEDGDVPSDRTFREAWTWA
jgi:hypothetical protein|tara:strand:- start:33 stop:170 length:138 start_codon:yes stop_codon:yes gene_type:complete